MQGSSLRPHTPSGPIGPPLQGPLPEKRMIWTPKWLFRIACDVVVLDFHVFIIFER